MNVHLHVSRPVERLFDKLLRAMVAGDAQSAAGYFALPFCSFDRDRTNVFRDRSALVRGLNVLWGLNVDLGMVDAEALWIVQHHVSSDFILADVNWRLTDADFNPIGDQRTTYTLRGTGDDLRIVAMFLHEDAGLSAAKLSEGRDRA